MSELISVVIPTYNRSGFIMRAVNSVLEQSWGNKEVIVVDDGSTDNSREILSQFDANPHFRYIFQKRAGRSAARNHGVSVSKGEWIMFLDSDDYLLPHALETLQRLATSGKSDVAYANFHHVRKDEKPIVAYGYFTTTEHNRRLILESVNGKYWLCKTGTYMLKRSLAIKTGGFSTDFEPSEDLDYAIKVLLKCRASYTSDTILHVERHAENTPDPDLLDAIVRICKYHLATQVYWSQHLGHEEIKRIRFALRYKVANTLYELNRHGEALGYYVRLIANKPFLIFEKFVFKQFIASMIPPMIKMKVKNRTSEINKSNGNKINQAKA